MFFTETFPTYRFNLVLWICLNITAFLSWCNRSYCLSSQGAGISRDGKKARSRSLPPTSTTPTPTNTTGALMVRGVRRSGRQHGQLSAENRPVHPFLSYKNPQRICNLNRDTYNHTNRFIESCKRHEFFEWWMWPVTVVLLLSRCDRILWRGKGLKQVQYETCNYRLSDHRPVRAIFHAECDVSEGTQVNDRDPLWTLQATVV